MLLNFCDNISFGRFYKMELISAVRGDSLICNFCKMWILIILVPLFVFNPLFKKNHTIIIIYTLCKAVVPSVR
jgi:hypothetical protein